MDEEYIKEKIPVMHVGRYAGTPVDQLPNSYLRWIIAQDFPKDILECAKRKIASSDYNNEFIHVTRHALDMFSRRFLHLWGDDQRDVGIATFVAKLAQVAWNDGSDVSKHRHANDGVVKLLGDIKWVFGVNQQFPDYKEVITIMPAD